jgi:cobalt transporter subunit CbtB
MTATTVKVQATVSQRAVAGFALLLAGLALVYMAGFAPMALAHNTAHDTRHAIGFPCH